MSRAIRIPDLGAVSSELVLRRWLKAEGDYVMAGEAICEVESDKAVSDLESVAEGWMLRRVVSEGSPVQAGDVIAHIGKEGEEIEEGAQVGGAREQAAENDESRGPSERPAPVLASPMIIGLAERLGIDLERISGTGPGGQITRADLLQAGAAPGQPVNAPKGVRLSGNQLAVARTIAASLREAVPISFWGSINMDRAIALRERGVEGKRISYDAMFIFALARAARENPVFECYFERDALVSADAMHVALTVGNDKGLFLPVIRNADRKSLGEINAEVGELAAKAAEDEFTLEDLTGATMTVSNLGMLPVDSFTAIIPPRQSAILTVGRARDVVAFRENRIAVNKIAQVIVTVDHRFINGREAARFLSRVAEEMEGL